MSASSFWRERSLRSVTVIAELARPSARGLSWLVRPRAPALSSLARPRAPALSSLARPRARFDVWVATAALTCATAVVGCIPSHRMVHDGDTYFERCYAADFDSRLSEAKKEGCWQAWLAFYTRHQPAHRVDFALRRIEALQNGEPPPELPGSAVTALAEATWPASANDGGIAPTDAPLTVAALPATSTMEGDGGPVPHGCQHFCKQYASVCNARCHEGTLTCWHGCEAEMKLCLRGCY